MLKSVCAVGCGAFLGALLRWAVSEILCNMTSSIPLGTLAVNIAGSYLMGVVLSMFALFPSVSPEWRLLIVTGFLGSLTTFSSFSAEMGALIRHGALCTAVLGISLHLVGALVALFLGMWTVGLVHGLLS